MICHVFLLHKVKNLLLSQMYFLKKTDSDIKTLLSALMENETAISTVMNFNLRLSQFCRLKGPCSFYTTFNVITKTELRDLYNSIIKLHNMYLF